MDEELELIKDKIKFLEEQLSSLKQRVSNYEKKRGITPQSAKCEETSDVIIEPTKSNNNSFVISDDVKKDFNNEEKYIQYFIEIENGDKKTAIRHFDQLHAWKKRLTDDMNFAIEDEVYYIDDPVVFNKLVLFFESNDEMKFKNSDKHHYYYSAAYNAFNRFLKWKHSKSVETVKIEDDSFEGEDLVVEDNHAPDVSENLILLEEKYGTLVKVEKNCYKTSNGKVGFVILNSKVYPEKDKNTYWFAFRERKFVSLPTCEQCFLVLGFGSPLQMYLIPKSDMLMLKERLRPTMNNDGTISHYHMVLFEKNNIVTIRVSFPVVEQVELTKYKFKP